MDSISTTRIDLQKLQLLNDRICQCLDALNQVRLSAHATGFAPTQGIFGYQPNYAPNVMGAFQPPVFGSPFHSSWNVWNGSSVPYGYGYGINSPVVPYGTVPYNTMGTFPTIPQFGYGAHAAHGTHVFGHSAQPNGHVPASYPMAW